jgi:hypothetical protein
MCLSVRRHNNPDYLVGIHVGSIYVEDEIEVGVKTKGKEKNEIKRKIAFVEGNLKHKSSLESFIASSIIHIFLVQHKLMEMKNFPAALSSQAQSPEHSRFVMNKS